jgi:broad specificity phosphatase PhoE
VTRKQVVLLSFLLLFTASCNVTGQSQATTPKLAATAAIQARTIILVRHGEVDPKNKDAGLTPAGLQRAEDLAVALKNAGITKIFTSEKTRTQQTAAPLAKQLNIKPDGEIPQFSKLPEILNFVRDHADKNDVVLVVFHSYSIPGMLKSLTGTEEGPMAEETFDNLFVLLPDGKGDQYRLIRGRYGAASPAPAKDKVGQ